MQMHIFIYNNQCFNVDNDADAAHFLEQGARELTTEEIKQYGMAGFEQYVSPANTVVNADGSVAFTPPDIAAIQAEQRRAEIISELDRIDRASSRSLRAILTAQAAGKEPDSADVEMLAEHEADAKALRAELAALNA